MEPEIGTSPKVLELKSRVEALPYGEAPAYLRAELATQMIKDAVDSGKMPPEAARGFADSLCRDCVVPVSIGNLARKVFPIETVVTARPLIVSAMKDAATAAGADYEGNFASRRKKAEDVADAMQNEYGRQDEAYGPFARFLSPDDRVTEMGTQAQKGLTVRNILSGGEEGRPLTPEQNNLAKNLLEVDVANIVYGRELANWLTDRK